MARLKTGHAKTSSAASKVGGRKRARKSSAAGIRAAELEKMGKTPGVADRMAHAREVILGELRKARSISGACEEADIARSTFKKWRDEDPAFNDEVVDALEQGYDSLEDEAIRRGKNGYRKAVYHQGEVVGYERRYSDRLLETSLMANRPGKFRNNHSVEVQGQIAHTVTTLTKEELLEQMAAKGLPTSIFEK